MVQIMNRPIETSPAPSLEGDPNARPNYINTFNLDEINAFVAQHPNTEVESNGNIIDSTTGEIVGIDPILAADEGMPIQVGELSDDLLAQVLERVSDPQPDDSHYPKKVELRGQLIAEGLERERKASQTTDHNTAQLPASDVANATSNDSADRRQRGFNSWLDSKTPQWQARGKAKEARKELKKHKKLHGDLDSIEPTGSETFDNQLAATKARRAELEEQAGGYKDWRKAQAGERRSVTKVVRVLISHLHTDPEKKEARTVAKQERTSARDIMTTAHHRLLYIDNKLKNKELDQTVRAELEAERTERLAVYEEAHTRHEANRHRTLGNRARKAVATDHDAEFDKLPMPNDEARVLFKDLHDKRIKALKLGLEAGYKIRSRKRAYESAYLDYKNAYFACEAAIIKHETDAEGPLTIEQTTELVTGMVLDEIKNMQAWQYQLAAEAQGTRRGRAAVKFHRQGKMTKFVLFGAAGLATGGLAGLAGGAIAGSGLVLAKVARSEGSRWARGMATQGVYEVTKEDISKYQKDVKSSGEIFDKIFTDQVTYVEKSVRNKKAGLALAGLGFIGGAYAGEWLNDHIGHGKTAEVSASRPAPGGVTGSGSGGAETVPPIGESRRVDQNLVDVLKTRGGSAGAARIDGGITAAVTPGNSGGTVAAVAEHYVGNISPIDGHTIEYPWDVFGNDTWSLADKAIAGGENMQWRGEGTQAQLWAKVDGKWTSDTDTVVNLLKKYR